jgi:hypothetical protein
MAGEFVIRVTGDVRDVLAGLKQTEQAAQTSAGRIGQSFNKAFNRNTASGLAAELERLSRIQGRVRVEGAGFEAVERRLQAVRTLQAAIERKKLLITADSNSVAALSNRLETLREKLNRVAIGGRVFQKLQRDIRDVERELARAGESGERAARGTGLLRSALSGLVGLAAGASLTGFIKSSVDAAVELHVLVAVCGRSIGCLDDGNALKLLLSIGVAQLPRTPA